MGKIKIVLENSNQSDNVTASKDTEMAHTAKYTDFEFAYLKASGFDVLRIKSGTLMADMNAQANAFAPALRKINHTNASAHGAVPGSLLLTKTSDTIAASIANILSVWRKTIYKGPISVRTNDVFFELRGSEYPTVYDEIIFHDNLSDETFFHAHIQELAKVSAKAICDYFKVRFVDPYAIKPTVKPTALGKGSVVQLNNAPLYATSTTKTAVKTLSGKYWLWDGVLSNGRFKITNAATRVGVAGQVTGWVPKTNIK